MSKRTSLRSSRYALRCILLLGLSASATTVVAQEADSAKDRMSSRMSVNRRNDANVQKDIDAANKFREQQAAEFKATISISDTPAAPESKKLAEPAKESELSRKQSELPAYGDAKDKQAAKTDDGATTPPSLKGSSSANGSPSTPSSRSNAARSDADKSKTSEPSSSMPLETIIEGFDDCGTIVISPADDLCGDEIVTLKPVSTSVMRPASASVVPASSSSVSRTAGYRADTDRKDDWSDNNLVDKISKISGGAFEISALPEQQTDPQVVTSGYRYIAQDTSSSQPATNVKTTKLIDLGPPTYYDYDITQGTRTAVSRPVSYVAGYAQDAAAASAPTLNSESPAVVPAAFQGGYALPGGAESSVMPNTGTTTPAPGNFSPPSSSIPLPNYNSVPSLESAAPSSGIPSSPYPNSSTITPSLGGTQLGGSQLGGTTLAPQSSIPYDRQQPLRSAIPTVGEPFVTEGPCQFDAYQMVTPVAYNAVQNTAPNYCTPWALAPQQAGVYPQTAAPGYGLPGYIAPPVAMPTAYGTQYSNTGVAVRPLLDFGQSKYPYQVGRGLIGQPVAYIPGQRFRNFFRYFFP